MGRTPLQMLADNLLKKPVEDYIAAHRAAGDSWRRIALDLRDRTKGAIDVTPVTIQAWAEAAAASAPPQRLHRPDLGWEQDQEQLA